MKMALRRQSKPRFDGGGLVLFLEVQDAMQAERVLKRSGYQVRLVAPPPELRRGCDLAVEVNLVEKPGIERLLNEKDVAYVSVTPLNTKTQQVLEVVKVTDFGKWLMARAGNMKVTFEKESGVIVNVSGGGCPDIPYIHSELIGKKLREAPKPKDIGFTLCALNADRALEECITLYEGGQLA